MAALRTVRTFLSRTTMAQMLRTHATRGCIWREMKSEPAEEMTLVSLVPGLE